MFIYFISQVFLLTLCFFVWLIDRDFLSVGYFIYHMFPLISCGIAISIKKKVQHYPTIIKLMVLIIPFIIWLIGVFYISGNQIHLDI